MNVHKRAILRQCLNPDSDYSLTLKKIMLEEKET